MKYFLIVKLSLINFSMKQYCWHRIGDFIFIDNFIIDLITVIKLVEYFY